MPNDPLTGARLGDMNDGPLGGLYLAEVVSELRAFVTPRFATDTARDAAYTAAGVAVVDGMKAVSNGREFLRRSGTWVKQGGLREIIYDNPDMGGSGQAPVGTTSVIYSQTVTSPVATDVGAVDFSCSVEPSGAGVMTGSVTLVAGGQTRRKVFVGAGERVPISIVIPACLFAGGTTSLIQVKLTLGSNPSTASIRFASLTVYS